MASSVSNDGKLRLVNESDWFDILHKIILELNTAG